ncbi:HOOK-domain-containing protein [Gymnopus androsaceus JB14]|uniref:HOOK-domain-containing protein n=1 Tax=Gymnopus androsaceus JB14 TaxID=1447944 RepID=A0A6A4IAI3_9AGAR|nr:HOOK-domain-containing protein [Gymnopus androsaceus JB14]
MMVQSLYEVLSLVDSEYFRQSTRPSAQSSDNWVLRFGALKRLYRLMTQYFSDVLQKPTSGLDVPNLQAMAKDGDDTATLVMCRMTIAIGVQCEKNKEFIDKIQGLSQVDQHHLMKVIEQVMTRISATNSSDVGEASMTEDDHYYRIQSEKSVILNEKEVLEKVYQQLLEEHRLLQTTHDDVLSERGDLVVDNRRSDGKADVMLRAEIDRLRADLQKSEDNLAMAESELDKQTTLVTDLTRKVEDLQVKADEAAKLKDELYEMRHTNDKFQKMENVLDKYKKKLQEASELRQRVRSLEKQNADLVDNNASLEEEYRKVAAFKPLMESYKNQISELENKATVRTQDMETLKFELEQTRTKLKIDSETIELYQERVRELELSDVRPPKPSRTRQDSTDDSASPGEPLASPAEDVDDEDDPEDMGLGGELHDAEFGTTMTDLKLQIRKLKRELEAVRKNEADASRVLVLENLLDDANRMKSRYEADYLAAHREKLVLQRDLEEIRSGKSMGDGAEAAIALRQRLNESVDQLDALRKEHAELEVKHETLSKELTIAKSDLTLVNKDQLDILASLRESVNEDKAGLESDLERVQKQNKELVEKNRMQLEQVNALLLEKVNLQSEGIGQREKMLQRERDFGDLRASLSGKDLPEDIKQRLLALHEDNVTLKESLKTANEKLTKAKTFIKNQDKLYKEETAKGAGSSSGMFEEAEGSMRSQIKILEDDLDRQKTLGTETHKRYLREQELMLSVIHSMGMNTVRGHLGQRPNKSAWLTSQRTSSRLQRNG